MPATATSMQTTSICWLRRCARACPTGPIPSTWRSLSAIDVHPDEGRYRAVRRRAGPGQRGAGGVAAPSSATPETTLGRWWFFVAASLFGGVLATWKLVLAPLVADAKPGLRVTAHRRTYRLIVAGGVLLILGTLFSAVAQAGGRRQRAAARCRWRTSWRPAAARSVCVDLVAPPRAGGCQPGVDPVWRHRRIGRGVRVGHAAGGPVDQRADQPRRGAAGGRGRASPSTGCTSSARAPGWAAWSRSSRFCHHAWPSRTQA